MSSVDRDSKSEKSVDVDESKLRKHTKAKRSIQLAEVPSEEAKAKAETVKSQIQQQYEKLTSTLIDRDRQQLSADTIDRSTAAKFYLEQQWGSKIKTKEERLQRRQKLEETLSSSNLTEEEKTRIRAEWQQRESQLTRQQRMRLDKNDFTTLKIIGRGGFAEVRLVRKKDTGEIYAMKILRKADVLEWNQVSHVRAERDILAQAATKNEWVTELYFSFQDAEYLYLIMEYVPGGDLMSKLVAHDIFSVDVTRFYVAEILLAVNSVHQMSFIHRDIKPDNILIDKEGHIKLTDFGLCTGFDDDPGLEDMRARLKDNQLASSTEFRKDMQMSVLEKALNYKKKKRELAYSTVGSPNYIAPEVLLKSGYGKECDYWSVGIIMFEMLFGYPPFCSTSDNVTYWKIVRWRDYFSFPENHTIDPNAIDLIKKLICDPSERTGGKSFDEIKSHPFFAGINWDAIRQQPAPFKPNLTSETDTSYFEHIPEAAWDIYEGKDRDEGDRKKHLPFVGYTFKRFTADTIVSRSLPTAFLNNRTPTISEPSSPMSP